MKDEIDEMKESIKRGIKKIGKRKVNKINPKTLDMGNECKCAWGQANNIKNIDQYENSLMIAGIDINNDEEIAYGFFTYGNWDLLNQLWKEELTNDK